MDLTLSVAGEAKSLANRTSGCKKGGGREEGGGEEGRGGREEGEGRGGREEGEGREEARVPGGRSSPSFQNTSPSTSCRKKRKRRRE